MSAASSPELFESPHSPDLLLPTASELDCTPECLRDSPQKKSHLTQREVMSMSYRELLNIIDTRQLPVKKRGRGRRTHVIARDVWNALEGASQTSAAGVPSADSTAPLSPVTPQHSRGSDWRTPPQKRSNCGASNDGVPDGGDNVEEETMVGVQVAEGEAEEKEASAAEQAAEGARDGDVGEDGERGGESRDDPTAPEQRTPLGDRTNTALWGVKRVFKRRRQGALNTLPPNQLYVGVLEVQPQSKVLSPPRMDLIESLRSREAEETRRRAEERERARRAARADQATKTLSKRLQTQMQREKDLREGKVKVGDKSPSKLRGVAKMAALVERAQQDYSYKFRLLGDEAVKEVLGDEAAFLDEPLEPWSPVSDGTADKDPSTPGSSASLDSMELAYPAVCYEGRAKVTPPRARDALEGSKLPSLRPPPCKAPRLK